MPRRVVLHKRDDPALSPTATLCLSLAQPLLAQNDVKGAHDHPLISRMPGTDIVGDHTSDCQEFMIATGRITPGEELPPVERFEGTSTTLTYRAEKRSLSALAIFRNFKKAFEQAGFEPVFTCKSDAECGDRFVRQLYWYGDPQRRGHPPYLDASNRLGDDETYFYWSGTGEAEGGTYIISLLVAQQTAMTFPASIVLDISQTDDLEKDGPVAPVTSNATDAGRAKNRRVELVLQE